LRATLEQLQREIKTLSNLLKKKRENFNEKFSYQLDEKDQRFTEFDLFTLGIEGKISQENQIFEKCQSYRPNDKSIKILYKKMKEFIFSSDQTQKLNKNVKNNKRIIGIVIIN
jgi:hypothetical protein